MSLVPEASAQGTGASISGRIRDTLGLAVAGARVESANGRVRGESDATGRFTLRDVPTGAQELQVRRIGYQPTSVVVSADAGAPAELDIRLVPVAQRLAPVVVRGRESLRGNAAAFYSRRESGRGRFLTGAEIDQRQLWSMRDIMRTIPGSRTQRVRGRQVYLLRGATTPPVVYLDGVRMAAGELDLNMLDPRSFLGIEIYSGIATTPPEFAMSDLSGRNGGVIVVWTREGKALPRRPRRGEASAATMVSEMLASEEVRTAENVEEPARLDPTATFSPVYPDSLLEAQAGGSATVEFVVQQDGQVRLETLSVVSATHPAFGTAARDAVLASRFIAGRHQGRPIAQVVLLTVRFDPTQRARP